MVSSGLEAGEQARAVARLWADCGATETSDSNRLGQWLGSGRIVVRRRLLILVDTVTPGFLDPCVDVDSQYRLWFRVANGQWEKGSLTCLAADSDQMCPYLRPGS